MVLLAPVINKKPVYSKGKLIALMPYLEQPAPSIVQAPVQAPVETSLEQSREDLAKVFKDLVNYFEGWLKSS